MIQDVEKDAKSRMLKSIDAFKLELSKIRTGRANTSLLDHVTVSYYGSDVPLSQVGNINIEDSRTLVITPWEKTMVKAVEKAIMTSDLGLNPVTVGTVIRVPMPMLTEERRRDLTKIVRHEAENAKVAVRNIRRDAMHEVKELTKEKLASEDDASRASERIQKMTDQSVEQIDALVTAKEKDLMEV